MRFDYLGAQRLHFWSPNCNEVREYQNIIFIWFIEVNFVYILVGIPNRKLIRLKSINTVCYNCLTNIWTGRELPDSLSLEECGVENGATLKLILAMRGGPINTRRVVISNTSGRNPSEHGPNENATSSHIEDIMLKNKDKLLDKIPKNGQVFKFVSIINMLWAKFIFSLQIIQSPFYNYNFINFR